MMTQTAAPAAHSTPIPLPAFTVLRAAIESLAGKRPLHHVRRLFAPLAFQQLSDYVDATGFQGLQLRTVTAQMPHAAAVEATATLSYRGRRIACTLRLDRGSRWVCSHIEVIGLTHARRPYPQGRAA